MNQQLQAISSDFDNITNGLSRKLATIDASDAEWLVTLSDDLSRLQSRLTDAMWCDDERPKVTGMDAIVCAAEEAELVE